jgi:hypothetical protein
MADLILTWSVVRCCRSWDVGECPAEKYQKGIYLYIYLPPPQTRPPFIYPSRTPDPARVVLHSHAPQQPSRGPLLAVKLAGNETPYPGYPMKCTKTIKTPYEKVRYSGECAI